jgi:hypothetical protein
MSLLNTLLEKTFDHFPHQITSPSAVANSHLIDTFQQGVSMNIRSIKTDIYLT